MREGLAIDASSGVQSPTSPSRNKEALIDTIADYRCKRCPIFLIEDLYQRSIQFLNKMSPTMKRELSNPDKEITYIIMRVDLMEYNKIYSTTILPNTANEFYRDILINGLSNWRIGYIKWATLPL